MQNNVSKSASKIWVWAGLLVVMTAAAYLPATQCGYIWDDDIHVQKNETLRSLDGLKLIWFNLTASPEYYPLTFTTFWVEYNLWGLRPFGYHLDNILQHAVNALLLWWLLVRLRVPGALLAAAIFALHPVHVESVAWVTERKNVLSGLFYLLSLHAFLSFDPLEKVETLVCRRWGFYVLSLVLFLLAMFSKTVTLTLPVIILVIIWWKQGRVRIRRIAVLIPYFVVAAPLCLIALHNQRYHTGAFGQHWDFTLLERIMIAGRVLWFYADKLFWPANLTFIYPKWQIDTTVWWQYLFVIGAAAVPVIFWFLSRWLGRGAIAAVIVYGLTLVPASGLFNIYWHKYTFVADHVQYLASMALITLVVGIGYHITARLDRFGKGVVKITTVAVLVTLGALTWRQCHIYKDRETLWYDTLQKNPDSWLANNNYGKILHEQDNLKEAIEYYRTALQVNPDYWQTHNNMGQLMLQMKQFEQAIRHFNQVPLTVPEGVTPNEKVKSLISKVHYHLGIALSAQGKKDEAIQQFREALLTKPEYAKAHNHLGLTLQSQGKMDDAIKHYRQAITAEPNYTNAHMNLGFALQSQDKLSEALGHYQQVLKSEPNSVVLLNNTAWILATHTDSQVRNANQAITFAERAAKLTKHQNAQILDTLAAAYAAGGQFDQAVATAEAALNLAIAKQNEDLANHIRKLLQRYKQAKP